MKPNVEINGGILFKLKACSKFIPTGTPSYWPAVSGHLQADCQSSTMSCFGCSKQIPEFGFSLQEIISLPKYSLFPVKRFFGFLLLKLEENKLFATT